jgi:hypothetical protein
MENLSHLSKQSMKLTQQTSILKQLQIQINDVSKLIINKQKEQECSTCGQSLSTVSDAEVC